MQSFDIHVQDNTLLLHVIPALDNKANFIYKVVVAGHEVTFHGNPGWSRGGPLLVPVNPHISDPELLDDIAEKIEEHVME